MIVALMYLFIIVVPGIFVLVTFKRIVKAKHIQQHGIQTQGLIIKITSVRHGSSNYDHLLLEYRDSDGKSHEAKTTTFQGHYQRGGTMPLHYLQHKPSRYSVDGVREAHVGILLICAVMLGFMIWASVKLKALVEEGNLHFLP